MVFHKRGFKIIYIDALKSEYSERTRSRWWLLVTLAPHYNCVIMTQITSLTIVYSTVYSGEDLRKHQSSASLAFVQGIHRWPVNCPRKGPVTRKGFPLDDVIMTSRDTDKRIPREKIPAADPIKIWTIDIHTSYIFHVLSKRKIKQNNTLIIIIVVINDN